MNTKFLTDEQFEKLLNERVTDERRKLERPTAPLDDIEPLPKATRTPGKRVFTARVTGQANHRDTCGIRLELVGFSPEPGIDESDIEAVQAALSYLIPPRKKMGPVVEE